MKHNLLEKVLVSILLVVAVGVVVHAPLTVWLGTIWPEQTQYIKAWKEVLMGVALVLLIVAAMKRKMVSALLDDRLMQLALIFAGLHFALMAVFQNGLAQAGAGLLIDLRFVLYFVLVYGTLKLYPNYRHLFIKAFAAGMVVVLVFSVLQQFVLPRNILTHIGYSKSTISPYLLVDENPAFVRINSTLRGPNPLGAYAVIVLGLLAAVAVDSKLKQRRVWWMLGVTALAAGLTLGASYSRSALIGAVVALTAAVVTAVSKQYRKYVAWSLAILAVVVAVGLFVFRSSDFVANVILHDSPTTGASIDSNTGHVSSVVESIGLVTGAPLGYGVGSAGSASLIGNEPLIIENQYLFVAHEVGWIGLALFVWLFVEIMRRVWHGRKSILAQGVFASGLGLAIIGLFLPVWTDDTVSIVWWGLAAVVVSGRELGLRKKKEKVKHHDA